MCFKICHALLFSAARSMHDYISSSSITKSMKFWVCLTFFAVSQNIGNRRVLLMYDNITRSAFDDFCHWMIKNWMKRKQKSNYNSGNLLGASSPCYNNIKLFYFQQNSANLCQIFLQVVAKILSKLFSAWQYYICKSHDVGDFGTKSN